jgi:hypothetical protein
LKLASGKRKTAFVGFDFAVDLELLFKDFTDRQKDVFFGLIAEKEERSKGTPLYDPQPDQTRARVGAFEISYFAGRYYGSQFRSAPASCMTYTLACGLRLAAAADVSSANYSAY